MIHEQKEWLKMPQGTVNERLKFLMSFYSISARTLSRELGVADTNTQNYVGPKQADPGAAYLEKLLIHFNQIDAYWLLTGDGEPFVEVPRTDEDEHDQSSDLEIYHFHKNGTPISTQPTKSQTATNQINRKISRSLIVGHQSGGTATQNQGLDASNDKDVLIEQLRSQLADKERTIQILLNKL